MPTSRPFAYNAGSAVSGTEKLGSITIGITSSFDGSLGGLQWYNGPDEDLGYIICKTSSQRTVGNNSGVTGLNTIGFWRSPSKTENSFTSVVNQIFGQSFTTGDSAKSYLNTNGYWTSWENTSITYDPDAQSFITAAALTDTTQKSALDDLVLDLKAAGLWTKMKALYPIVGGVDASHAVNLKTPGTYNLSFTAGWVHSSTGMTPNGTSDYADTGLNAQTVVNTTNHLSYYSRTLTVGAQVEIGIWDSSVTTFNQIRPASNYYAGGLSNGGGGYTTTSDARGFWLGTKRSSSDREMYLNGVSQTTLTGTDSSNLPNGTLYLGARRVINSAGVDYYSNKQCAFASIGDGLTDLESNLFYQIVEKFQYALGRNINATQSFYYNRNYSNETNAFIFNGGITSSTHQSAINTLVNDLKAADIWTKMKALYPMVGGTVQSHKFNLKDPRDSNDAYRLLFSGGSHDSNGYSNSVGGYAETYLISQTVFPTANISLGIYSRTQIIQSSGYRTEIGAYDGTNFVGMSQQYDGFGKYFSAGTNNANYQLPVPGTITSAVTTGLQIGNRLSNIMKVFQNGVELASKTVTNSSLSTNSFFIGAYKNPSGGQNDYSQRQIAFASIGDGLTDLESNLFYQIVEKFQYTLGRNVNTTKPFYYNSSYTNETNVFIFNAGLSSSTHQSAINTLVNDLKAAGIWTKMKAVYPMVGGTALAHKFNLVNPVDTDAAFRLRFYGGGTHSSTGYNPGGATGYADTNLIASNVFNTSLFPHQSYYSRTNSSIMTDILMGGYNSVGSFGNFSLYGRRDFYSFTSDYPSTISYRDAQLSGSFDTTGFLIGSQDVANVKLFKNNSLIASNTLARIANAIISTRSVYIGAQNRDGVAVNYTDKECAFSSIGDGLTDLESNLFYQIVEKFQYTLGRNVNTTQPFYYNSSYTNETNVFIFNAGLSISTHQASIQTLVSDLVSYGLWTKMKAIYPMVGGTTQSHKLNLKDPRDSNSAFRLSFLGGGWTQSSTGAKPNGSTSYADTFLTPSSSLTLYSTHISFYSRTNTNVGGGTDMGGQWQQVSPQLAYTFYQFNGSSGGNAIGSISSADANRVIYTQTNPASFVVTSRTANNSLKSYTNGILKATNTTVNTSIYNGLPQNKVLISAFNYYDGSTNSISNYSNKECAFASIGDGLTDNDAVYFAAIVNKFQTTLGRNIYSDTTWDNSTSWTDASTWSD